MSTTKFPEINYAAYIPDFNFLIYPDNQEIFYMIHHMYPENTNTYNYYFRFGIRIITLRKIIRKFVINRDTLCFIINNYSIMFFFVRISLI